MYRRILASAMFLALGFFNQSAQADLTISLTQNANGTTNVEFTGSGTLLATGDFVYEAVAQDFYTGPIFGASLLLPNPTIAGGALTNFDILGGVPLFSSDDMLIMDNPGWTVGGDLSTANGMVFNASDLLFSSLIPGTYPLTNGGGADVGAVVLEIGPGSPVAQYVPPAAFTPFRGLLVGGDLQTATVSNDQFLAFNPGFTLNSTEAPVWLIFDAELPDANAASVDILLESNAGTPGLSLTTEAWNFTTSEFDEIDVQNEGFNADTVRTFPLTTSIHVEAGTGAVRTRAGWRQIGFVLNFPWEVRVDQVGWNVN